MNLGSSDLHSLVILNDMRQVFDKLARHGRILVVVDQPASIGALPVPVARRPPRPGAASATPIPVSSPDER